MSIYKVFIASPSDVEQERNLVEDIVNEVNSIVSDMQIQFVVKRWENANPQMGNSENVIMQQLKISECHVFIGILWCKFGTETGNHRGDYYYLSGTEEEFDEAYDSWKAKTMPHIMFYRCVRNVPFQIVGQYKDQIDRIDDFFKKFGPYGEHPGLYKRYEKTQDFKKSVRKALIQFAINKWTALQDGINSSIALQEYGFNRLFTPNDNELRNSLKRESMETAREIKLIAHSGHSFIGLVGSKYRYLIDKRLESGAELRIILINPLSEGGFFISCGESEEAVVKQHFLKTVDGINRICNPIQLIAKSKWFKLKVEDSISGYDELRNKYGERIQVRFARFDIPASILITDCDCFYEPYLPIKLAERQLKGMLTFELKMDCKSPLYQHSNAYFEYLWGISDDIDAFRKNESKYKELMEAKN